MPVPPSKRSYEHAGGEHAGRKSRAGATARSRKRRALSHLDRAAAHHLGVLSADEDEEDACAASMPPPPQPLGHSGASLHADIVAFTAAAAPTAAELCARERALLVIRDAVVALWPEASVLLFGSAATGLSLPLSDLDLVLVGVCGAEELEAASAGGGGFTVAQRARAAALLARLRRALQTSGAVGCARVIPARVPIIRCTMADGLPCDLSIGVANGVAALPLVASWLSVHHQLRPLLLVLKSFLAQRRLHDPYTGGVGGWALLNLVVAYLQSHADTLSGDLGEALIGFFRFYGHAFDYRRCVVSVARGGIVPRSKSKSSISDKGARTAAPALSVRIEDPQEAGKDIGASAFNIAAVRHSFRIAAKRLDARSDEARASTSDVTTLWAQVQADGQSRSAVSAAEVSSGVFPVLGRVIDVAVALRRRTPGSSKRTPLTARRRRQDTHAHAAKKHAHIDAH